jgi:hypothetical protein
MRTGEPTGDLSLVDDGLLTPEVGDWAEDPLPF